MTKPLDVFFTERAPAARALWLQKVLQPLAAACRVTQPPSVEVRPTGQWGGWCQDTSRARDGRICLTSKIVFWSAESIKCIYLHECAHRLLEGLEIEDHGPEFLCLLSILLFRATDHFKCEPEIKLDLYDFQNQPEALLGDENWRGIVLNWSLKTAAELADGDTDAEDLAGVICERWQAYLVQRQLDQAAATKAAAGTIAQRKLLIEQVADLKNSRLLWRCLACLGWVFFTGLVWLNLRGFQ